MLLLRRCIRKALDFLLKSLAILAFKIVGPPRVLRYGGSVNAAILRAFGADLGKDVGIYSPVVIHNAADGYTNLTMGDNCVLLGYNFLDLTSQITLEKGVSLGPGVTVMTHNEYNGNAFLEERLAHTVGRKPVLIKEGTGVKARALIVHGVTIGKNVVVGGGAVVNRDVPDHCFVAGVPARVVKEIK